MKRRRKRDDRGGDGGAARSGEREEWGVGMVSVSGGSIGSCRMR